MGSSGWGDRVWVNLIRVAPLRAFTGIVRALAGIPVPRAMRRLLLGWAARRMGMDLREAELPVEEYRSLGALFVRKLRADARPMADAPRAIVSPVDGCFVTHGIAEAGQLVQAKGIDYRLADLVGDEALAARFDGGAYMTIYLRPKDYHRIHYPVAGTVVASRRIPGALFPVQPSLVRHRRGLFVGNERLVVELRADQGSVLVVPVGAAGVGTISTSFGSGRFGAALGHQTYAPGIPVARGDELGAFNLGSTVILIFERGTVEVAALRDGQEIRVGAAVGRWRAPGLHVVSFPAERAIGQARSA
jgi:phosphatidylserine decarboxylase